MSFIVDERVEAYALKHTAEVPGLLKELAEETQKTMAMPQMLTGPIEGRFLKLMVQAVGARRVLEVGMFTGYATLSMAEGLPEGGELLTCEIDDKAIQFASRYFKRSPHGKKVRVLKGPALENIKGLKPPFDFVFIDADKNNYPSYYEEALRLLRPGGLIALDNMLWSGRVLSPEESDKDTLALAELNKTIVKDKRVESVLLTVRDGIQLVRKL